jgi:hypothetical protein
MKFWGTRHLQALDDPAIFFDAADNKPRRTGVCATASPAGFFYGPIRWVLDWIGVAGFSEAISMESLGAGARPLGGGAHAASRMVVAVAVARKGSAARAAVRFSACRGLVRLCGPLTLPGRPFSASWPALGGLDAERAAARSASVCTAACISSLATCA